MMSYTYATSFLHFLHWTNKLVKWECDESQHLKILQVLDGGTDVFNPSKNVVLFFSPYFCRQKNL